MQEITRELLFSVTAKDCAWDYVRGSGKGGQKRNKTSSAVRCRHLPSGAIGYAEDTRSQLGNKRAAFVRMANTKEFKAWHRIEIARRLGDVVEADEAIKDRINTELNNPSITVIEVQDCKGRWVRECPK